MEDEVKAGSSCRRRRRLVGVLIGFIAVLVIVATPIVLLSWASADGNDSISAAKRVTEPMLADLRSQVERDGGRLSITWSTRPMGGMQMVEVTLRGPGTEFDGRAGFMVSSDGIVDPQDDLARTLVMTASPGMSHP